MKKVWSAMTRRRVDGKMYTVMKGSIGCVCFVFCFKGLLKPTFAS